MKCGYCQGPNLRLKGFSQGREQWVCQDCGQATPLLDCDLCERRLVRRLAAPGEWACVQCAVTKRACPSCGKRWLKTGENVCHCCLDAGRA